MIDQESPKLLENIPKLEVQTNSLQLVASSFFFFFLLYVVYKGNVRNFTSRESTILQPIKLSMLYYLNTVALLNGSLRCIIKNYTFKNVIIFHFTVHF